MNEQESKCPKCGSAIPYVGAYCAGCGHNPELERQNRRSSIGFILAFVLVGLPAGLCGACFLALGGLSSPDPATSAVGIGGIVLCVLLLGLMIRSMVVK